MPPKSGHASVCVAANREISQQQNACVAVRHTLQNGERPSEKRKAADTSCAGTV
ncbi:hypothetical protein [Kingella potus]|uniref:hypothetical protein n=1 Tax=Kingella potus TaxID=265175 RepID=UPI001FD1F1E9|nr:hypothetical protein [Kingella potus]UOP00700.1 hypothetical protein LVJ84_13035 [Kingella potus]